jgi:hypothetical protein
MITIDMEKAKNIKREFIRLQRLPLFEKLDVAFMRAVESNDLTAQKEITKKKENLRNLTNHPAIQAAKTIDELKNLNLFA